MGAKIKEPTNYFTIGKLGSEQPEWLICELEHALQQSILAVSQPVVFDCWGMMDEHELIEAEL